MGEIDPSGRPHGEWQRAASARNLRRPEKRQRGGVVFRIGLLLALVVPAAFTSPWYVAYAAPLLEVADPRDVPEQRLLRELGRRHGGCVLDLLPQEDERPRPCPGRDARGHRAGTDRLQPFHKLAGREGSPA